jgi:Raf kinase inhibitor-like YbhB/YbcL family protein
MKYTDPAVNYKLMVITSPAFVEGEMIPSIYTCDGKNINPPLKIRDIPADTKSLALIVDDPDAPGSTWVHWIVWNIPVTHHLKENHNPGIEGINDFKKEQYGGPCPPSGTHRYFFKIYALDTILLLPSGSTKAALEKVMSEHIIGFGELIGLYKKKI